MNFKKVMAGLLILGLSGTSGIQLYAAGTSNENIKTNVVYTVNDISEATDAENDLEKIYNAKCFEILKNCFNITPEMLPKDAKFSVFLMSKDSLDKEEAHWLELCQDEFKQNKLSDEKYAKQIKRLHEEYDNHRNLISKLNHDIVTCQLSTSNTANGFYNIAFNANTKEAYSASIPFSAEGWEIQTSTADGKSTPTISATTDVKNKTFGINYIKEHHLGNIQNPEFVKIAGVTHIRIFYQDATDHTKKILLYFDPYTQKVVGFNCGENANN